LYHMCAGAGAGRGHGRCGPGVGHLLERNLCTVFHHMCAGAGAGRGHGRRGPGAGRHQKGICALFCTICVLQVLVLDEASAAAGLVQGPPFRKEFVHSFAPFVCRCWCWTRQRPPWTWRRTTWCRPPSGRSLWTAPSSPSHTGQYVDALKPLQNRITPSPFMMLR
jgi:hypothetical protein